MAYDGELVKLENGRWARFQRCAIVGAGPVEGEEASMLVAVELDDHHQDLLNAAEGSLEGYRRRGVAVQLSLDPVSRGRVRIQVEAPLH